jgi:hypothetical protein
MAFIVAYSRFNDFKQDFIKDTGLTSVEDNMELYIQYVTARFTDHNNRLLATVSNEIQELQKVLKKV